MKLGVVGLPNVGKSTLFNAITKAGAEAANYPFCTIEPNTGVVAVPDERLDELSAMYHPKKTTPAVIEFVDIAGLVKGASHGEGLGNKFLSHIRECEAIVHVVRCFEDPDIIRHADSLNPQHDIETINLELIAADRETVAKRAERATKMLKSGEKRFADEAALGEKVTPHPMMNGWALLEAESGDEWNFINADGTLLSPLWLEKAWPMTGDYTLGLVDTGNLNDTETRYTLYILGSDGSSVRWRSEATPDGVVISACGLAYLDDGEVVQLSQPDEALLVSDDVTLYPDCDAMVVRDPESGKYGLYVHGQRQYDFLYDAIAPAESDLQWRTDAYQGTGGTAALRYVSGAAYPQPLSHYFRLEKDGEEQYVALSTASACPVELN